MIKLVHVDESTVQFFIEQSARKLANDPLQSVSGEAENALKRSKEAMLRFLPGEAGGDGADGGAYVYAIVEEDGDTTVGYIWFNVVEGRSGREAVITDLYIFEPYQDRNYDKQALDALEAEARRLEVRRIGLHVYGENNRAYELYRSLGYGVVEFSMSKPL